MAEQEEEGEEEDSWLYGLAGAASGHYYDEYGRPLHQTQQAQEQQKEQGGGGGGGGCAHQCTCGHGSNDEEGDGSDSDAEWEAERVRSLTQVEALRGQPGYREDELGGKWVDGRHADLVAGSLALLCHLLAYHEVGI